MFTDARTWIFGGLALASLAGLRGAFNVRESLTLVPVPVKKFAAPDRRGRTALYLELRGVDRPLRVAAALSDEVEVFRALEGGYHVVSRGRSESGQPHIGWEWFSESGELQDDRFLLGRREVERAIGPSFDQIEPAFIAKSLYLGMQAMQSK